MLRIDSKRLPLKRSCTDVLNPSLVYGYECVMLLVWCSFCHWLLSLCFQMVDIVTEQWIQIHWLEQALHITQVSFFCLKLASGWSEMAILTLKTILNLYVILWTVVKTSICLVLILRAI
ncbi:unnamed protein product [Prunus brigantina]